MRQYLVIGPARVRFNSNSLASWGFPRLQFGGLSIWSWTSGGDLQLAAYHPRCSLTWLWFVHIGRKPSRGYEATFSREERDRLGKLYQAGNPYVSQPRWWHRFIQLAAVRRGQWTDYVRLPFGLTMMIGHQKRMNRHD